MSKLQQLIQQYKELCLQEPLPTEELNKLSREIDFWEKLAGKLEGDR